MCADSACRASRSLSYLSEVLKEAQCLGNGSNTYKSMSQREMYISRAKIAVLQEGQYNKVLKALTHPD